MASLYEEWIIRVLLFACFALFLFIGSRTTFNVCYGEDDQSLLIC